MQVEHPVPRELEESTPLQRFAYDRFAKGLMRWAPPVLDSVALPNDVDLNYEPRAGSVIFDVAITPRRDSGGSLNGFIVHVAPLSPAFILAVCAHFLEAIAGDEEPAWANDAEAFGAHLRLFESACSAAMQALEDRGLPDAIDVLYSHIGLTSENVTRCANQFNICSHFITNHEIAHAYSGQMSLALGIQSEVELRAFEHIADALAAEWLYKLFICEMANEPALRSKLGHGTYGEAIHANTRSVYASQLLVLLILMLASAANSRGAVTLAGGRLHPHTLVRHYAVNAHIATLVLSNQEQHFTAAEFDALDAALQDWFDLFLQSGLFGEAELRALRSPDRLADLKTGSDLIRRYQIESLYGLASAMDLLPDRPSI